MEWGIFKEMIRNGVAIISVNGGNIWYLSKQPWE
jgi:hypothetical protein